MIADGATDFTECGPGAVLQGLIKKIDLVLLVLMALYKIKKYCIYQFTACWQNCQHAFFIPNLHTKKESDML